MSSTIVKTEKNEVTLKIQVSAEAFEKEVQQAYTKTRGKFNVPGFRKGKAPRKIIEINYGTEVFYDEAINTIFPTVYGEAIKEHNLNPIDRPSLDVEEIVKGKDLVLNLTVTVKPEVTLGDYKGIEVEKKEYNVTDEEIEKEIEDMRERNSRLIAVEREVQDGDTIIMDYAGFVGEEQFEGGTAEKQTLVIGSGQFIPGFEEQLVGVKMGEEVEVKVAFPTEYHAKDLAGKDATFKVTVHEVKEKELPTLDDEFAKDVSEFDTLEELKADIKKSREDASAMRVEQEYKDALINKAVENAQVDVPNIMVEHQIDEMVHQFTHQLQHQGLDVDTYLQYTNAKMEDIREQMRKDAENRVKTELILEAIVKAENIEVTEEEENEEIGKYARQYNMELEKFKKSLKDSDYENIKDGIKIRKAVSFLADNAKK
ncbi:trigger factor [Lutibacter sp. B2]|nr:trigger factor [Lutibacter sp. B2]